MEKKLILLPIKVSSTPRPGFWTQSLSFEPQKEEQKMSRGKVLAVFSLGGSESQDLSFLGKETAATFLEEYYRDLSGSCLSALEKAVLAAQKKLFTLSFGRSTTSAQFSLSLNLAAAAIWGQVLYLVNLGSGQIQLFRDGKLATILESSLKTSAPSQILSASGFLKDGDVLILATNEFFQAFSQAEMEKLIRQDQISTEEFLQTKIHGQQLLQTAAVLAKIRFEPVSSVEHETISFVRPEEVIRVKSQEVKIRNIFDKILIWFSQRLLTLKSFFFKIKVRPPGFESFEKENLLSGKRILLLTGVVFLVLVLSVFWQVQKRIEEEKIEKAQKLFTTAQSKVLEFEGMAGLNALREKNLLLEAQEALREHSREAGPRSAGQELRIKELENKISQRLTTVWKIYSTEPTVFYDLTSLKTGALGTKMVGLADDFYILDSQNSRLYKINRQARQGEIWTENLGSVKFIAAAKDKIYLLSLEAGVLRISEKDKILFFEKQSLWQEIADFKGYLENIYLLDIRAFQIWRYTPGEKDLGIARHFISTEEKPDLTLATSFAIDGYLWVLLKNGQVLKIAAGKAEVLNITGLDTGFLETTVIYTDETSKYLYILDRKQKRIVVLDKNGQYQLQYQGEFLGKAEDLLVKETEKKIYVLAENKIYEMEAR